MIAKIDPPLKNFNGIIFYHEKKVKNGTAERILVNLFDQDPSGFNQEFEQTCSLKYSIKNKGFHISLNLPHDEKLPENRFINLANDYLNKMGFSEDIPYLVYKHSDKTHSHIHIIVSSIDYSGNLYNDDYMKYKSQKISRELEKEYNLTPTEYFKFDDKNFNEVSSREHNYCKALHKAFKDYSTKTELTKIIPTDVISTILKNNLTNKEIESTIGKQKYDQVGNMMTKAGFFKVLYKDELLKRLDYFHSISNNKNEFLSKLENSNIYIRQLTDKGYNFYCYGLKDSNFYCKDKNLPVKYRFYQLQDSFNNTTTNNHFIESEQKNILYNRIFLVLNKSNSYEEFISTLEKENVKTQTFSNKNGIIGHSFQLNNIDNPISFKASDIHHSLSYNNLIKSLKENTKPLSSNLCTKLEKFDNKYYKNQNSTFSPGLKFHYVEPKTQKEIIHKTCSDSLSKSNNIQEFLMLLTKNNIQFTELRNKRGIYGITFNLKNIKNPILFKGSEIDRKFSFTNIFNYFSTKDQSKNLSINLEQTGKNVSSSIIYSSIIDVSNQISGGNEDFDFEQMINKKKRKIGEIEPN